MKKLSFYLIASVLFVSCLSKQLKIQEIKTSKLPLGVFPLNGHKKTTPLPTNRIPSNIDTPEGCPDIWGTHRCVSWFDKEGKMANDYEHWYELIVSPSQDLRGYGFKYRGTEKTQHSRDNDAHVRRADISTLQIHRTDLDSPIHRVEFIADNTLRVLPNYDPDGKSKYKAKCMDGNLVTFTSNPDNFRVLNIYYPSSTSTGDFISHTFFAGDSNVSSQKKYSEKLSMAWKNFAQQTDFPTFPQEGRVQTTTQCFKL